METNQPQILRRPESKGLEEELRAQRLLRTFRESRSQDAAESLISQYRPLVEKLSRRFLPSGMPLEDLVQEGFIGLLHAIDHYDSSKNVKFITYATHCVAGQLRHFLRDRGQIIKEPAWLQELSQRVRKVTESLVQQFGRQPTTQEVADSVGLTEEAIADVEATRSLFSVASLEESIEQGSRTLAEREGVSDSGPGIGLAGASFEIPIDEKVVLEDALKKLKDLERRVIYSFYYEDHSQTEIARSLGISNNYVSHILKTSARKLQQVYSSEAVRERSLLAQNIDRKLEQMFRSEATRGAALEFEVKRQRAALEKEGGLSSSIVDSTTGLYSKTYFDARLEEELSRAVRHNLDLTVVRVRLGEEIKEASLFVKVSQTIKSTLRRSDIVARTGDHEIAAVLPYTGASNSTVAERLTDQLVALQAEFPYPFTFALGTASFPPYRKKSTLEQAAEPQIAN
jgi:RNA polymerase sigma-B factor